MRGLLLAGDPERSAALRHEIPIAIGDPLLFAEVDGRRYVLTTRLERDRVQRELPDAQLLDYFELGYKELVESGMSMHEAGREVEAARGSGDRDQRGDRPGRLSTGRSATASARRESS